MMIDRSYNKKLQQRCARTTTERCYASAACIGDSATTVGKRSEGLTANAAMDGLNQQLAA